MLGFAGGVGLGDRRASSIPRTQKRRGSAKNLPRECITLGCIVDRQSLLLGRHTRESPVWSLVIQLTMFSLALGLLRPGSGCDSGGLLFWKIHPGLQRCHVMTEVSIPV